MQKGGLLETRTRAHITSRITEREVGRSLQNTPTRAAKKKKKHMEASVQNLPSVRPGGGEGAGFLSSLGGVEGYVELLKAGANPLSGGSGIREWARNGKNGGKGEGSLWRKGNFKRPKEKNR